MKFSGEFPLVFTTMESAARRMVPGLNSVAAVAATRVAEIESRRHFTSTRPWLGRAPFAAAFSPPSWLAPRPCPPRLGVALASPWRRPSHSQPLAATFSYRPARPAHPSSVAHFDASHAGEIAVDTPSADDVSRPAPAREKSSSVFPLVIYLAAPLPEAARGGPCIFSRFARYFAVRFSSLPLSLRSRGRRIIKRTCSASTKQEAPSIMQTVSLKVWPKKYLVSRLCFSVRPDQSLPLPARPCSFQAKKLSFSPVLSHTVPCRITLKN